MDDLSAKYWPLAIGGYLIGAYLFWLLRNHMTKNWPTTTAELIELPAKRRWGGSWGEPLRRKKHATDSAISYSVDGTPYVKRIKPVFTSYINGVEHSKFSGLPDAFGVRYKLRKPSRIYYRHAYTIEQQGLLKLTGIIIGPLVVAYFLATRYLLL